MKNQMVRAAGCCGKTVGRRVVESVAMMMIGDGVLAVVDPHRHMKLWENGPHLWERIMRPFVKHPELTRYLGAMEVAAGIWLAQQQHRKQAKEESA